MTLQKIVQISKWENIQTSVIASYLFLINMLAFITANMALHLWPFKLMSG